MSWPGYLSYCTIIPLTSLKPSIQHISTTHCQLPIIASSSLYHRFALSYCMTRHTDSPISRWTDMTHPHSSQDVIGDWPQPFHITSHTIAACFTLHSIRHLSPEWRGHHCTSLWKHGCMGTNEGQFWYCSTVPLFFPMSCLFCRLSSTFLPFHLSSTCIFPFPWTTVSLILSAW